MAEFLGDVEEANGGRHGHTSCICTKFSGRNKNYKINQTKKRDTQRGTPGLF